MPPSGSPVEAQLTRIGSPTTRLPTACDEVSTIVGAVQGQSTGHVAQLSPESQRPSLHRGVLDADTENVSVQSRGIPEGAWTQIRKPPPVPQSEPILRSCVPLGGPIVVANSGEPAGRSTRTRMPPLESPVEFQLTRIVSPTMRPPTARVEVSMIVGVVQGQSPGHVAQLSPVSQRPSLQRAVPGAETENVSVQSRGVPEGA